MSVLVDSKAMAFLDHVGWLTKPSGSDQVAVKVCPFCRNDNYKFYMNCSGGEKDGLATCMVCAESVNLYQLKERLGLRTAGVVSTHDLAMSQTKAPPLPDVRAAHKRLMEDPEYGDVLDYLVVDRGFTVKVLDDKVIGAEEYDGKKWIVIPYFGLDGNCVYTKQRVAPPNKKAFRSSQGREAPLYNQEILKPGLKEIVFCEGELDTISLLSLGYDNVVGVPGANTKKAAWIDLVDKINPERIYILYDSDKVGQTASREMACRIGIEKVKNILIPPFQTVDGTPGKDINEYIVAGLTLEQFEEMKAVAEPFNVEGVYDLPSALQELYDDLTTKGSEPTLTSPWPSLTKRMGGMEYGDLVGILADSKIGKTTAALNWLQYHVMQGINTMMFCQEMPVKRMVRKWASMVTQTDDTPGRSKMTPDTIKDAIEIAGSLPGDLLFGYTRFGKSDEIFETIRQAVRRYGVKIVCFDNLQILSRSLEHSTQELSRLTKNFKAICLELGIVVLLIIQPRKVSDGALVNANDAFGSSAISKDVDTMICLNRKRTVTLSQRDLHGVMETEEGFEPTLYVNVDLCRYGSGGFATLYFDGATSTVRELEVNESISFADKPMSAMIQQEMVAA